MDPSARKISPQAQVRLDPASSLHYCMEAVKKADYENYLCCLLLPHNLRSTAFAIRAFNTELAQIPDITTDKLIAQMRFQFWKDTLEKIYNNTPPATPIARELYRAVAQGNLSRLWFRRLIESRLESLPGKPFISVEAAETHFDHAITPVLNLLLEAANVKNLQTDHAASHVGKAVGLAGLIRSVPFLVSRGQVAIPLDLLAKYSLSSDTISRIARGIERKSGIPVTERDVGAVKDVIFDLAGQANFHTEKARAIFKSVPAESLAIFLPIVACVAFLDRLRKADFDVFEPKLRNRDGLLPLRLWWRLKARRL